MYEMSYELPDKLTNENLKIALKIALENLNKLAIEIFIESVILLNLVKFWKIFCEGLSQGTEITFN